MGWLDLGYTCATVHKPFPTSLEYALRWTADYDLPTSRSNDEQGGAQNTMFLTRVSPATFSMPSVLLPQIDIVDLDHSCTKYECLPCGGRQEES